MSVIAAVSSTITYVKTLCSNCSKVSQWSIRSSRRFYSKLTTQRGRICSETKVLYKVPPKMEKTLNPTFKFTNYDCIGFDLDNTVARYKVGAMIEMEYEILAKFLIERGYSEKHLHQPFDHNFILKGLIIDDENGNLLRISSNGFILQASHGTKMLTDEEIEKYYTNHHWEPADQFADNPLLTWNGPYSEKMRAVLDYFDITVSLVFARAIDGLDEENNTKTEKKYNVWPDLFDALQEMFFREHFPIDKGTYFQKMKTEPSKYYYRCSDDLLNWLKMLKTAGKTLFLLTGSYVDFASHTASNTIGPNWRDYFDIVVCYAKKPGFFTQQRPFYQLDGFREVGPISSEQLQLGGIYSCGNWSELRKFLQSHIKKPDAKFLYVGDNLIQDIYTPTVHSECDTVAICEELEAEGRNGHEAWHPDQQFLISTVWGSYFYCKGQPTNWHNIMIKHSKLCVPSLEYVALLPLEHEYICTPSLS